MPCLVNFAHCVNVRREIRGEELVKNKSIYCSKTRVLGNKLNLFIGIITYILLLFIVTDSIKCFTLSVVVSQISGNRRGDPSPPHKADRQKLETYSNDDSLIIQTYQQFSI